MVELKLKLTPSGAAAYAVVLTRLEEAGLSRISRTAPDTVTGSVERGKERIVATVSGVESIVEVLQEPAPELEEAAESLPMPA